MAAIVELYDRNLAFFARRYPAVHALLCTLSAGETQLVQTADGRPEVIRHGVVYGVEASEVRRLASLPIPSRQGEMLRQALCQHLSIAALPMPHPIYDGRAYTVLVIGIGLGLFLKNVLQQAQCHHLLLFEPTPERLYHSLHVLDWEDTLSVLPPSHELTLLLGNDPSIGPNTLLQYVRDANPLATDGVVVLSPPGSALAAEIAQKQIFLVENWMYVDEKVRSLRNSFLNGQASGMSFVSLWRGTGQLRNCPVMIVGSGPSADTLMPEIRRLAPHCLVVAAGTAAHVLLNGGVMPDLWVIVGNNHGYYNEFRLCLERWPQARHIPLLLNEAADPRFLSMAERVALFGYSSNPLRPLLPTTAPSMAAPTVTNASLGLLADMGYDSFIFFGVDMGARDLDHRYSTAHPRLNHGDDCRPEMNIPVRGNLGGKVVTSGVFDSARRAFESYLQWCHAEDRPLHIRNCGDGALIRGTHPTLAHKLSLPALPHSKADEVARLWQDFPPLDPQVWHQNWNLPLMLDDLAELRRQFTAALNPAPDNVFDLADRLWAIVRTDTPSHVVIPLTQGLVVELTSYFLHALNRQTAAVRAAALPALSAALLQSLEQHCAALEALLTDLDQGRTDGSWLVWDED